MCIRDRVHWPRRVRQALEHASRQNSSGDYVAGPISHGRFACWPQEYRLSAPTPLFSELKLTQQHSRLTPPESARLTCESFGIAGKEYHTRLQRRSRHPPILSVTSMSLYYVYTSTLLNILFTSEMAEHLGSQRRCPMRTTWRNIRAKSTNNKKGDISAAARGKSRSAQAKVEKKQHTRSIYTFDHVLYDPRYKNII